ncbi:MAG: hypothetical protein HYX47_12870 [Burkholderiales bacterium]|nr:hypothetical protein [Burkholderiales bacterium]
MKHEQPLKGNPNQITVNQHVLPRSAIARFAKGAGLVEVQRLAGSAPFKLKPDDELFCARRAWDQGSETFRTHETEQAYAGLADKIVAGHVNGLSPAMDEIVSAFYSLWRHRQAARLQPISDARLNLEEAERTLDKHAEEVIESKGGLFIRGDTVPSRFMTGLTMMRAIDWHVSTLRGSHWGIVRSEYAHFLVPDGPGEICAVPLCPTICLCKDMPDVIVTAPQVGEMNRQLLERSASYYFGDELDRCPILRRTIPWEE